LTSQRVDAARNRKRVLEAAEHEHARHGSALGMQDVARRAGVGIGTVYRHFPSRQALIEAIAYPFFERGLRLAQSVQREHPESERFAAYARGFARTLATHGVHGQCTWDAPAAEPVRAELRALIGAFVEEGKRSGTLRQDFAAEDAFSLLWTIAAVVEASNETTPELWQRHVELVLDALSGRPPRALAGEPITRAEWDRFVRSTRVTVEHGEPAGPGRAA
jgi:AcrR family transcriptional regulator